MEVRRWKDDSNPYSLPRPSVRDKLLTVVGGDVPNSPLGRVAAVGRHDLSGDCRLFWLSTQIHLLHLSPRLRAAFQAASNLFEQPVSQQRSILCQLPLIPL